MEGQPTPQFESRYIPAWLETHKPETMQPAAAELLKNTLAEIDQQVSQTTDVFHSHDFPGVAFPFATASVTESIQKTLQVKIPDTPPGRRIVKYILPGWNPPHHLEFHGLMEYLMLKDQARVMRQIARGEAHDDITYVTVGYPSSELGGSVSNDWIKGVKEKGLVMHGELTAEFLQEYMQIANWGEQDGIVFHGFSTGAAIAAATTETLLSQKLLNEKQVSWNFRHPAGLTDVPSGTPWGEKVSRVIRYPLGFGAAGMIHSLFDSTMKSERASIEEEKKHINEMLKDKIRPDVKRTQERMKKRAAMADYWAVVWGIPFMRGIRTRAFGGGYDLTQQPNPFATAAKGIGALIRAGGKIQDVSSPKIPQEEIAPGSYTGSPFHMTKHSGVRMAEFPVDHYENYNWAKKIDKVLDRTLVAREKYVQKLSTGL